MVFLRSLRELDWHGSAMALGALLTVLQATGCKGGGPSEAAVRAMVISDMDIPKDLDAVTVSIAHEGATLASKRFPPAGEVLKLPVFLDTPESAKPGDTLLFKVVGWRGREARVVREALVQVPSKRSVVLPLELAWLCDQQVDDVQEDDAQSSCGEGNTCVQGRCVGRNVDANDLKDAAGTVDGEDIDCFTAPVCFEDSRPASVDLDSCTLEAPNTGVGLNVAMVLPPGSDGVCDSGRCLLVLDAFSMNSGWSQEGNQVRLPAGVCDSLDQEKITSVHVATVCPAKTVSVPVCTSSRVEPLRPEQDAEAAMSTDAGTKKLDAGMTKLDAGMTKLDASSPTCTPTTEVCNGLDDDCDGNIDNGITSTFYVDGDGDGFGNATAPMTVNGCTAPEGHVANKDDCNDLSAAVAPSKPELCNFIDDNCNNQIDEGCAATSVESFTNGFIPRNFHSPCDSVVNEFCYTAASRYCRTKDPLFTVSGFGPSSAGPGPSDFTVTCLNGNNAEYQSGTITELTPFHAGCANVTDAATLPCFSAIHKYCENKGFASGVGPVEHMQLHVQFACVKRATVMTKTLTQLAATNASCSSLNMAFGNACMTAFHQQCKSADFASGYGPIEVNAGTNAITFVCLPKH